MCSLIAFLSFFECHASINSFFFQTKWLENHTLSSGTYPYSQYMRVPHPRLVPLGELFLNCHILKVKVIPVCCVCFAKKEFRSRVATTPDCLYKVLLLTRIQGVLTAARLAIRLQLESRVAGALISTESVVAVVLAAAIELRRKILS